MKTVIRFAAITLTIFCCVTNANQYPDDAAEFAEDVMLHVVLHEIGHGLIREFDLPVLGNEETMADAFATHYLIHHLPERALDVLAARMNSLIIEASEVPRDRWSVQGEHNSDARRAYQIVALAIAADPLKYSPLGKRLAMSESELNSAIDYGSEIHRSWRRILRPLIMPVGMQSHEARVRVDPDNKLVAQLRKGPLLKEVQHALKSFDWHSQVTVFFIQGDGGSQSTTLIARFY